mgnify:CR=1 FL=1
MEEKKYTAKIILEGKEKFINDSNEIKESLKDLDETTKQLNESLEKTAKLLSELRWLDFNFRIAVRAYDKIFSAF